jgi:hypothetical protein
MGNVADAPRLLLTVTVPGFVLLSWLGSTRMSATKEPSLNDVLSAAVPICLPLEVRNTVKVAPALASNPATWRNLLTELGDQTALLRASRSELPVPMVMVSRWVRSAHQYL